MKIELPAKIVSELKALVSNGHYASVSESALKLIEKAMRINRPLATSYCPEISEAEAGKEKWKPIDGFSRYAVSDYGRVQNLYSGRIMKVSIQSNGYGFVSIMNDDRNQAQIVVHRLVATAFIKNPRNHDIVNHIDGNRLNNREDNLEWCSQKLNARHSVTYGLRHKAGRHCRAKLSQEDVLKIRKQWETGRTTMRDMAEQFNVTIPCIKKILDRKTWKHI